MPPKFDWDRTWAHELLAYGHLVSDTRTARFTTYFAKETHDELARARPLRQTDSAVTVPKGCIGPSAITGNDGTRR